MGEYVVKFYKNSLSGDVPLVHYLNHCSPKIRLKITKYIEYLRVNNGYLDEPYSKHIVGKIRELRVDFANERHRIFYFTFIKQTIVMLHGFIKKTNKTPPREISRAIKYYNDVVANPNLYEKNI